MQLRERVFMFLAIIICCVALADAVWLSPAQLAHKQVTLQQTAQGVELQRLRDELKTVEQPVDASKTVREDMAATNRMLDAINAEIKAVAPLAEGGPAIEQALVQFLRRQDGLNLLRTKTIDTAPPAGPTTPGTQPALSRRGLELSVSGSYADLVQYVSTLETALPSLRWGALELKASQQRAEMILQVYVVGVPP